MKKYKFIALSLVLLACSTVSAQERKLTIEPGLGIHTNAGTDLLLSNLAQWNLNKRFSLAAHTSFNFNNILQRDVESVKTDYNYSINQKFGAGTSLYSKKSSHSFFLMMGLKYTTFKETLYNPNLDQVSVSINGFSPDYGLLYSYKKGLKKCFFTFRAYLPLYPWPMKGSNINYVDGNMENISLEFGMGIKIK